MKVLVTGGAGLIGSHTVDQLLARGHEVRIYDSLELPTHAAGKPSYLPSEAEFVHADVRDTDALRSALEGMDAVIHLAATGGFTPRIADYVEVNSLATARMLEMIRDERLPIRKIVVASSIAVYGEGAYRDPDGRVFFPGLRALDALEASRWEMTDADGRVAEPVPTPEDASVDPASAYAISKYDQERLTLQLGRDTGIPCVALRYFVTYGPRQSVHNPYTGVCTIFATRIANGQPIVIYEDGRQSRDFVYVGDVAGANVHVLESDEANGQVLNVGSGKGTPLTELASTLQRVLGQEAVVEVPGAFRPADAQGLALRGQLGAGAPGAVGQHRRARLEVAALGDAVGRAEALGGFRSQHRLHLRRRPDVETALRALAVRILAGEVAAVGRLHLAPEEGHGLADRPEEILVVGPGATPGLDVDANQLPLVVEHLLEVGHGPARVDAVAVEAAAELVVAAAPRHLATGENHVVQRLDALARRQGVAGGEQQLQIRRSRELGRAAEAAVLRVGALQQARRRPDRRLDAGIPLGCALGALGNGGQDLPGAALDVRALLAPGPLDPDQELAERGQAVSRLRWEVGAAVERAPLRRTEDGEGPAAVAGHAHHRVHVDLVHVRAAPPGRPSHTRSGGS